MTRLRPIRPLSTLILTALAVLVGALPAVAQGATRHASVAGTGTTCSTAVPCAVGTAVASAAPGDEVVVGAGTYEIATPLAVDAITLRAATGARPLLRDASSAPGSFVGVTNNGRIAGVALASTVAADPTVTVNGGILERTLVTGAPASGVGILARNTGTVASLVRNSIVRAGTGVRLSGNGNGAHDSAVYVSNVTSLADAYGLHSDATGGSVGVSNSILEGATQDVLLASAVPTSISFSNFDSSSGVFLDLANQAGAPVFADRTRGDLRQGLGSPTVDAGGVNLVMGFTDYDGDDRIFGSAPDIGAYEARGFPIAPPTPEAPVVPPGPGEATPPSVPPVDRPARGPGTVDEPAPPQESVAAPRGATVSVPAAIRMGADGRFPLTIACPATSPSACAGSYSITVAAPRKRPACPKPSRSAARRCVERRAGAKAAAKTKPKAKPKPLVVANGTFEVAPGTSETVQVLARNGRIREIRKQKGKCRVSIRTTSFDEPVTNSAPLKLIPASGGKTR